jgi:hypothetical protein
LLGGEYALQIEIKQRNLLWTAAVLGYCDWMRRQRTYRCGERSDGDQPAANIGGDFGRTG